MIKKTLALLGLTLSLSANASFVYESAVGGFTTEGCCSSVIGQSQILGVRFELEEEATVGGIGGHFLDVEWAGGGGSIFAAIVELNPAGFPSETSLTLDSVITSVVFTPIYGDYLAEISALTLGPGTYGVVLGSGMFGATGMQGLTSGSPTSTNGTMFFSSSSQEWQDLGSTNYRIFLAEASTVPVSAAAWLFGSALIGLAGIKRKK